MIEEPTKRSALPDLILTNKEGLIENVKVQGSLGRADYEMVGFRLLRGGSRGKKQDRSAGLQETRLWLSDFKDLLGRVPWDEALEGRGA